VPIEIFTRRWQWILLGAALAALLAIGAAFLPVSVRESDKTDAARYLVAWIVEGRSVPGSGIPNARWLRHTERFFVQCDFLPPEISLSDDPRVQRVTAEEEKALHQKHGFDKTVYIGITLKSENDNEFVLLFSNVYGGKGGHGDEYIFRRNTWGLRGTCKPLWVS